MAPASPEHSASRTWRAFAGRPDSGLSIYKSLQIPIAEPSVLIFNHEGLAATLLFSLLPISAISQSSSRCTCSDTNCCNLLSTLS